MARRRKTILVAIALVVAVAGFTAYWRGTGVDRQVNVLLDQVRTGEPGWFEQLLIKLRLRKARSLVPIPNDLRIALDLSQLGPAAAPALIRGLQDGDSRVRETAALALGHLKDPRTVFPLIKALKDQDDAVRLYAAMALRNLTDPRAVDSLIAALNDENAFVRSEAAWALGELGDRRAVGPLIEALKAEHLRAAPAAHPLIAAILKEDVRTSMAIALLDLGEAPGVNSLIVALKDDRAHVREKAARALGNIGDIRAVVALAELLNDENADAAKAAKEAIERIAGQNTAQH